MVKKWEKKLYSIEKSFGSFDEIFDDIYSNNLELYDVKKLQGYRELYRIRIGKYRIIFEKGGEGNIILDLGTRGDIYKNL